MLSAAASPVLRPSAESIFIHALGRIVADAHLQSTVGVAGVLFFDGLPALRGVSTYRFFIKICEFLEVGIKRHSNVIPMIDFAFRLIIGSEAAAFEVSEVTDVMRRCVPAEYA